MKWDLPPKAKLYEALSAVAGARVLITSPTSAEVTSSDGGKVYKVRWSEDLKKITSDDSASKFQGYTGYPIVAVLMELGALPYREAAAFPIAFVPWNQLNKRHKRNYDAAVEEALEALTDEQRIAVRKLVQEAYLALDLLDLERGWGKSER